MEVSSVETGWCSIGPIAEESLLTLNCHYDLNASENMSHMWEVDTVVCRDKAVQELHHSVNTQNSHRSLPGMVSRRSLLGTHD